MKVLKAVRRYCRKPQMWVVHNPDDRKCSVVSQPAQKPISAQVQEPEFAPEERPTLSEMPAQTIVWAPEQPFERQWEVYDVKRKAPIAKCGTIFDAQRAARKARA